MDRARAVRLSMKCMAFLEEHAHPSTDGPSQSRRKSTPESAAVITIQGSHIRLTPVQEMVKHADMKNRRGVGVWWAGIKELTELMGGRPELV